MPKVCKLCTHPQREAIDRAIQEQKGSLRQIGRQWGIGIATMSRHAQHIAEQVAQAAEKRGEGYLDRALSGIERIIRDVEEGIEMAKTPDPRMLRALASLARVASESHEKLARLSGESQEKAGGGGTAVLILPPRLPSGAPAILDRDHWSGKGYDGPGTQPMLTDGDQIIEGEFEDLPERGA